jgi:hypothetical protein
MFSFFTEAILFTFFVYRYRYLVYKQKAMLRSRSIFVRHLHRLQLAKNFKSGSSSSSDNFPHIFFFKFKIFMFFKDINILYTSIKSFFKVTIKSLFLDSTSIFYYEKLWDFAIFYMNLHNPSRSKKFRLRLRQKVALPPAPSSQHCRKVGKCAVTDCLTSLAKHYRYIRQTFTIEEIVSEC